MPDEIPDDAPRRGRSLDPALGWLWAGLFVVVVLILSLLLYIVVAGVLNPPAPRTRAERQLFMLESVIEAKPESVAAWADYANAFTATGQYSSADEVIARAVAQLGEGVPEIELAQGKLLLARGVTDEARVQLESTIEVTIEFRNDELQRMAETGVTPPASLIKAEVIAEAALLMAQIDMEAEDWERAIESLDVALSEQPTNSDALVMRGHVRRSLGDAEAARADFEQALVFIPGYEPALEGLRMLEEGAGQ